MSRKTVTSGVSTLIVVVLGLGGLAAGAGTASAEPKPGWGKTSAPNQVLRKGCHNYKYNWDITPPEGNWALETFLTGPGGKPLASGAYTADFDPKKGTGKFRICKPTTRFGRFTIKAKVSVQNGDEYQEGWLKPSHFRMKRPS